MLPTPLPLPDEVSGPDAVLAGWDRQALLVLGGPGTGKTTLVGRAAAARLAGGGPAPLVLASGRTAAGRLRNQVAAALGPGSWRPAVTTVHALARSLWQRFAERDDLRLLAAPEQEFRVRELLAGGAGRWPEQLRHAIGTRGFAAQVRLAIARARQLGLDPEDLAEFGAAAGRPEWVGLAGFFAEYLDVLDAEGVLDYAELIHRVRLLIAEPEVGGLLAEEIGSVLVDDLADLDPSQLGLIAGLAGDAPLLATADPDSVASGFRGADPHSLPGFAARFATPNRPAALARLDRSWRCGPELAEALSGVRSRLPAVAGLDPLSLAAAPHQTSVVVVTCADEAEQAAVIADRLRRARLAEGIGFGQMAVLVRSGRRQLAGVARALAAAGLPVRVPGDEIPLAEAPAVRPLLLGLGLATRTEATPGEAVRLLSSPLGGFDAVGLRRLGRLWRRAHPDVATTTLAQQLAAAFNDPSGLGDSPDAVALNELVGLLAATREAATAGEPVDRLAWRLWQGTAWPQLLRREAAAGGATGALANADLDALCAFFETAAEADRRGGAAGLRAFLAEIASQQIPADREREGRVRADAVTVLTAHRARGLEWDVVVLAGVQEGLWPSGRRVSAVLDAGELDATGLTGRTGHRELLAAERRLFHLACSRARRQLLVTATNGTEGEANSPSRFLAELGVAPQRPEPDPLPNSLPALVAGLRREAVASDRGVPLQAAAAVELAWLASRTDERGRPLAPAADPANWWGVLEPSSRPQAADAGPLRLSPSQVASVLSCPRRYFLSRQAGGDGGGLAATLGSVIHLLVQRAVTENLSREALGDALDRVWHQVPFPAAWLSASERVEVELGLARFLEWRRQRRSELVGVEVPFSVTVPAGSRQVMLEGKIDWLERTDEGLRVVDFKTSRTQPTKAAVAGMEQLGAYQLAVEAGGFEAGKVSAGAAAVYLRQPGPGIDLPREFAQPSLRQVPYLGGEAVPTDHPTWAHQRLAAAADVIAAGDFPATPGQHCRGCAFASSCPADDRGRPVLPCD